MPAILGTLINGFVALLGFFSRLAPWLTSLVAWFKFSDALKVVKFISLSATVAVLVVFIGSIFTAFVNALMIAYNALNSLFAYINSSASSSSLHCFFSMLQRIGILDAFTASMPLLFSAISFYFIRLLYLNAMKIYSAILDASTRLF